PFGRGNRAAAADQDAEQRALRAAEDAAENCADAGARADLAGFTLDAFALERLADRAAHRIGAPVDAHLVERDGEAALAIGARRLVHRANDAARPRAGGNQGVFARGGIDLRAS